MDYLYQQMKKRRPDVQQIVKENQNTTVFETTGEKEEELKENLLKRRSVLHALPAQKGRRKAAGCLGHNKTNDEIGTSFDSNKLQAIRTGKTPQSRDGHTGMVHDGLLIIFGGDRH